MVSRLRREKIRNCVSVLCFSILQTNSIFIHALILKIMSEILIIMSIHFLRRLYCATEE